MCGGILINNNKYYKYLGSALTEDMSCWKDTRKRIATAKGGWNGKSKLWKKLREKVGKILLKNVEEIRWVRDKSTRNEDMEGIKENEKIRRLKVLRK